MLILTCMATQKRRLTLNIRRGAEISPSAAPEGCCCKFTSLEGSCLPRPIVNPSPPLAALTSPVLLVYIGGFALLKNGFSLVLLVAPLFKNGLALDEKWA